MRRSGAGRLEVRVDAPLVTTSQEARAAAQNILSRAFREREKVRLRLGPGFMGLRPGDHFAWQGVQWAAIDVETERGVVIVIGSRAGFPSNVDTLPSDAGRIAPNPDIVLAPTQVALFEIPDLGDGSGSTHVVAAATESPGWKPVPLSLDLDGSTTVLSSAATQSVSGVALGALEDSGQFCVIDRQSSVEVQLIDPRHWLQSATESDLLGGANIALLGSELIQFAQALPQGEGRFVLKGLIRGYRGTDWAMASHSIGEPFAMVEPGRVVTLALPIERVGSTMTLRPEGLADEDAIPVEMIFAGERWKPPRPANLEASWKADGSLAVNWTPRSRQGWAWIDGLDAGIGESSWSYEVIISSEAGVATVSTFEASVVIDPALLPPTSASNSTVSVCFVGEQGRSHLTSILIPQE
ncbi:phage tail protein [Sphingomicrobium nitratireducens]|uniref:GTA baseplate fiber-binding domain-containing protein n=1 Tax=Sphingomicrobium nitratireducens TaxID=2964666 RepID=UPI0023EE45AD|nr:phage tail protein [Sphingomicrobium nitratireducens]